MPARQSEPVAGWVPVGNTAPCRIVFNSSDGVMKFLPSRQNFTAESKYLLFAKPSHSVLSSSSISSFAILWLRFACATRSGRFPVRKGLARPISSSSTPMSKSLGHRCVSRSSSRTSGVVSLGTPKGNDR